MNPRNFGDTSNAKFLKSSKNKKNSADIPPGYLKPKTDDDN